MVFLVFPSHHSTWTPTALLSKKKYFDGIPANEVRKTAPKKDVKGMNDEQWQALVNLWSDAKHKVQTPIHG